MTHKRVSKVPKRRLELNAIVVVGAEMTNIRLLEGKSQTCRSESITQNYKIR